MSILFSQVREDPLVELHVINTLNNQNRKKKNCILIIGSGGCTVLSLLNKNISRVHCIDKNINQLYLIQLKIAVINGFGNNTKRVLDFFEGRFTKNQYDNILYKLAEYLSTNCYKFWESNMDYIYYGINQSGVYEKLFKELIDSDFDYDNIFGRDNLVKKFGEEAVNNSKNNEFTKHFKNIVDYYKKNYNFKDNYFFHQILFNRYHPNRLPPYFKNVQNIRKYYKKIDYLNSDIVEHLNNITPKSYDIVDLSNITDWVPKEYLDTIVQQVFRALNDKGFVIARRLNGDYNLEKTISEYFKILKNIPVDKSHFYKEVVVGQKI